MGTINIIETSYMESLAIEQLKNLTRLADVQHVVGLPDLHPGNGIPVGAVTATQNMIYPHLIGGDIGCGISLYRIPKGVKKLKKEQLVKKLERENWYDVPIDRLKASELKNHDFHHKLGTIGGGNHFLELQTVEKIVDTERFKKHQLNKKDVYIMVHSGSSGYGGYILDKYIRKHQAQHGLKVGSEIAKNYLLEHHDAIEWAKLNRYYIVERLLKIAGVKPKDSFIFDSFHNYLEEKDGLYLHRKGAAGSNHPLLAIPGSRGDYTYLVEPILNKKSLYSIAHGAGRKWNRHTCKAKLASKFKKEDLKTTDFKSHVICKNTNLLYEEAPQAYKKVNTIIESLEREGLIHVVAVMKPIITYKQ